MKSRLKYTKGALSVFLAFVLAWSMLIAQPVQAYAQTSINQQLQGQSSDSSEQTAEQAAEQAAEQPAEQTPEQQPTQQPTDLTPEDNTSKEYGSDSSHSSPEIDTDDTDAQNHPALLEALEVTSWDVSAAQDGSVTAEIFTKGPDTYALQFAGTGAMQDFASVTALPYATYAAGITDAKIGDGITNIGSYALGLTNLATVKGGNTLTTLDNSAFMGAFNLTGLDFSASTISTVATAALGGQQNQYKTSPTIYVKDTQSATALNSNTGGTASKYCLAVIDGGSFASDAIFASATLTSPIKAGYSFEGWYTDAACTQQATGWTAWGRTAVLYANYTAVQKPSRDYQQSGGFEPYGGWQGSPWDQNTDPYYDSVGGTERKGWPSVSLINPLSQGVTYTDESTSNVINVVTDVSATNTSTAGTEADPYYYKNIILPPQNASDPTMQFDLSWVGAGGVAANYMFGGSAPGGIIIATSENPADWTNPDNVVWTATAQNTSIISATSGNWWKRLAMTIDTAKIDENRTYYLVVKNGTVGQWARLYANVVFEFSTDMSNPGTWQGNANAAGYGGQQGNGNTKIGMTTPAPTYIKTDLDKITYCYYNSISDSVDLDVSQGIDFVVHADGSGSNWQVLANWATSGANVAVYDSDPTAQGSFSTTGLTPVASGANSSQIAYSLINPNRDWPSVDGIKISVSGLEAATTYYLVFSTSFGINAPGPGKPVVFKFTTDDSAAQPSWDGYSYYQAFQGSSTYVPDNGGRAALETYGIMLNDPRGAGYYIDDVIVTDQSKYVREVVNLDALGSGLTGSDLWLAVNAAPAYYYNIITSPYDATGAIEFVWERQGPGGNNASYSGMGAYVKIYSSLGEDGLGKDLVAACTQDQFQSSTSLAQRYANWVTGCKWTIPSGTLDPNKTYYLVFEQYSVMGNGGTFGRTMNANIVYEFTTQSFQQPITYPADQDIITPYYAKQGRSAIVDLIQPAASQISTNVSLSRNLSIYYNEIQEKVDVTNEGFAFILSGSNSQQFSEALAKTQAYPHIKVYRADGVNVSGSSIVLDSDKIAASWQNSADSQMDFVFTEKLLPTYLTIKDGVLESNTDYYLVFESNCGVSSTSLTQRPVIFKFATKESATESSETVYTQEDGFEPYLGWQDAPWTAETDPLYNAEGGGTTRKGYPAWSLTDPLSIGVMGYQNGKVTGTDVLVVTDTGKVDTSGAGTYADPYYYKNIILPSYDVSGDSIGFTFNYVGAGGVNLAYTYDGNGGIMIATSPNPEDWNTEGVVVWEGTSENTVVEATTDNWWKNVICTVSTENLEPEQTYYLVVKNGTAGQWARIWADIVFEFSTDIDKTSTWQGDIANAAYGREQGHGGTKLGIIDPAPSKVRTDITKLDYAWFNMIESPLVLWDGGEASIAVHTSGSGSNWTTLSTWTGSCTDKVFVYDVDPTANGGFDTSSLTPVASYASQNLEFSLVNEERDWPSIDGLKVTASGLVAGKVYYLVFSANLQPSTTNPLGKPIVFKFTAAGIETWDVSAAGNGSLMASLMPAANDTYTLALAGQGDMKDFSAASDVPWANSAALISSVVIPEGVTSIGAYAFSELNNTAYRLVKLPSTTKSIGVNAFANCANLWAIDLTACTSGANPTLLSIGNGALWKTDRGSTVYLDNANAYNLIVRASAITSGNVYQQNTGIAVTNGGRVTDAATIAGSTFATLQKDGYEFEGWFSNAALTTVGTWTHVGGSNNIRYAGWSTMKDALATALDAANANLISTETSADGKDIATEDYWVTPTVKQAFADAIVAAQVVYDSPDALQDDVSAAITALATAKEVFDSAKQLGTRNAVTKSWEIGTPVATNVVAELYEDGSLVFAGTGQTLSYAAAIDVPWNNDRAVITSIMFGEGVSPQNLDHYFSGCTSLAVAPVLPGSTKSIQSTFENCTSLLKAPVLPASITNLQAAFKGCSALNEAPETLAHLSAVTNISEAFAECMQLTQLSDNFAIPANTGINTTGLFKVSGSYSPTNLLVMITKSTDETLLAYDWISDNRNLIISMTHRIATADELKAFASAVNAGNTYAYQTVVLEADIDLSGFANWTPIAHRDDTFFKGDFDGQGHVVKGMTVSDGNRYAGLFGRIADGSVKNVTLVESTVEGQYMVAGIVAHAQNNAVIEGCLNDATVACVGGTITCGGVVSYLYTGARAIDCINTGAVSGVNNYIGGVVGYAFNSGVSEHLVNYGTVSFVAEDADWSIGGVAGWLGSGSGLRESYNLGSVNNAGGSAHAGGVVGMIQNNSFLEDSYNAGSVTTAKVQSYGAETGGVASFISNGSRITNCYNVGEVSGAGKLAGGLCGVQNASDAAGVSNLYYLDTAVTSTSAYGAVKTAEELSNAATFIGFDFDDIWTIDAGADYQYPTFKLQGGNQAVDKTALAKAIADANAAAVGVKVSSQNGSDVYPSEVWVNPTVMQGFLAVIGSAEDVYNNSAATQLDVDNAKLALDSALPAFNQAKKPGIHSVDYPGYQGLDQRIQLLDLSKLPGVTAKQPDVEFFGEDDTHYNNNITTPYNGNKDVAFAFNMSRGNNANGGDGALQKSFSLPFVSILDAEGTTVANYNNGAGTLKLFNTVFDGVDGKTQGNTIYAFRVGVEAGKLAAGTYTLRFDKGLGANNGQSFLGKHVDFSFTVVRPAQYELVYGSTGSENTTNVVDINVFDDNPVDVIIPSTFEGKAVVGIADSAFSGKTKVATVTVPASVTTVGSGAFASMPDLTWVKVLSQDSANPAFGSGVFSGSPNISLYGYPAALTVVAAADTYGNVTFVSIEDGFYVKGVAVTNDTTIELTAASPQAVVQIFADGMDVTSQYFGFITNTNAATHPSTAGGQWQVITGKANGSFALVIRNAAGNDIQNANFVTTGFSTQAGTDKTAMANGAAQGNGSTIALRSIDSGGAYPTITTISYDESLKHFDNYLTDNVDAAAAQISLTLAGPGSAWDVSRWDWDDWTTNHLNGYLSLVDAQTGQTVATLDNGLYWINLGTSNIITLGIEPDVLVAGQSYTLVANANLTGHNVTAALQKAVHWTFEAKATDIATASIASIDDQLATGAALEPALTVTVSTPAVSLYSTALQQIVITPAGSRTLTVGADYSVSYADNVEAGQASVTITGIGKYTGTKQVSFNIVSDLPELEDAIAAAEELVDSVQLSQDNGNDIPNDTSYILSDDKQKLLDAIEAAKQAQAAAQNDTLTDDQYLAAQLAINQAINAFNAAVKTATVDLTALHNSIESANNAASSVAISVDGSDVAVDTDWATAAMVSELLSAVKTANATASKVDASQNEANAALQAITSAIQKFQAGLKAGTKVAESNNGDDGSGGAATGNIGIGGTAGAGVVYIYPPSNTGDAATTTAATGQNNNGSSSIRDNQTPTTNDPVGADVAETSANQDLLNVILPVALFVAIVCLLAGGIASVIRRRKPKINIG